MDEPVGLTTVRLHRSYGNEKCPSQLGFDHFRRMLHTVGEALHQRATGERPVGTMAKFVAVSADRVPAVDLQLMCHSLFEGAG